MIIKDLTRFYTRHSQVAAWIRMDYPYAATIYIHLHPCVPHPPGFQIRKSEKLECLGFQGTRSILPWISHLFVCICHF